MNRTPDAREHSGAPGSRPDAGTRCPRCGNHFSSDGRFCPFDGEPLVRATDWDPSADPLLGTVVDERYAVEALIGEGGMGSVYRVRHVLLGKTFALKALRKDVASDEEIAERFIHEARTAASVSHPGLVRISDFGRLAAGEPYFVMEYLDGVPLSSLLRRFGALPVRRARSIARQVAQALAVVHDAGIVHRDLKPDNVQIRSTAQGDDVKIVDFGLAKVLGSERVTRQGVVFGTPYYMSPEQAMGEPLDRRSDLYALGIVLYEMLTGRVPFEAATYTGVLTKHITLEPEPPSDLLGTPGSLGAIEAVVLRCLEKKPEQRYASAAEFVAALDALPEREAPREIRTAPIPPRELARPVASKPAPPRESPRPRARRAWLGVLAVVASAGLGAAVVASLAGGRRVDGPASRASAPDAPRADGPRPEASSPLASAPVRAPSASPPPSAAAVVSPSASARKPRPRPRAPERSMRPSEGIIDPWAR